MTRSWTWGVLLAWLGLLGCQCRPGPVDPVELGIRVDPSEVDFGRVLEGDVARRTLTLSAETRAPVTVRLATSAPFGTPPVAEVPGGGDVAVELTFRATDVVSEGVLTLTVGEKSAELKLRGTGVRPPPCIPSKECVTSTYSLELDACVEAASPDDAPCDPKSLCLEQGRCRAGVCLGIARSCDDDNECTLDACSMELGCVNTARVCPQPTAACRVATCDPQTGCGAGLAPDATPCGPADCVSLNICASGACTEIDTPEGFPCAPAMACLPEATCQNDVCTRPAIAPWTPDWSARLHAVELGALASMGSQVFFSVCAPPDAGPLDGGAEADGGVDAGTADAGLEDGGDDAGADAGPGLACALTSYTGTGFERFTMPYGDDARREVWAVTPELGVVLRVDAGLELRSPVTGALREAVTIDGPLRRDQLVVTATGLVFVRGDGGLWEHRDGGQRWLADAPPTAAVAAGPTLFAWDADAGVLVRIEVLDDAGVVAASFSVVGAPALVIEGASTVLGSAGRTSPTADGGRSWVAFDWSDAGVEAFLEGETLALPDAVDVFFQRCDGGPGCAVNERETWVRAFEPATGAALWEAQVLPRDVVSYLLETSLLSGQPGAVATVVRADLDGGPQAFLQIFSEGERKALCRLPLESGALLGATFTTTSLVVSAVRADGGLVLEGYPLGALPLSSQGWPRKHGLDATRNAR